MAGTIDVCADGTNTARKAASQQGISPSLRSSSFRPVSNSRPG
jgi:hypothetical protein